MCQSFDTNVTKSFYMSGKSVAACKARDVIVLTSGGQKLILEDCLLKD